MLQSSLTEGTGKSGIAELASDASLAGKTGTTYDFADNWFIGYNSRVTCGLWMGFVHGSRKAIYTGAFSRETLLPVWVKAMNAACTDFSGREMTQPNSVSRVEVCSVTGLRATRYCQKYQRNVLTGAESYQSTTVEELFTAESKPTGYCDEHGVIDPAIVKQDGFDSDKKQVSHSLVIPIQPKQPLLLGGDPYGTEQPDFAPRELRTAYQNSLMMNFDQLDIEDSAAGIVLDRPQRIEIHED